MIIGNLGKDAAVNTVNGKNVINFNLAHTEKYRDGQGNTQEKTTWVECAYWTDKTAIAPYLTKGKQVFAEGTPEINVFQRNDGTTGASQKLRVFSLQLLGGGNASQTNQPAAQQQAAGTQQAAAPAGAAPATVDDGLPF